MELIRKQEHEGIGVKAWKDEYSGKNLIQWENGPAGWEYRTFYRIGAEWLDRDSALVVMPKKGAENIDFMRMFMTCLNSGVEQESFSKIYSIDVNQPPIPSSELQNVIDPLLAAHFLSIVTKIAVKGLKKGYLCREENLKKVRGRIRVWQNEKENIRSGRFDRVFCAYREFSADIPENRLIKKALRFTAFMVRNIPALQKMQTQCETAFWEVGEEVHLRDVPPVRSHKLFREYSEALRLARLILRRFGFSLGKAAEAVQNTPVFWLDMSLLYEHYVLGLLLEAYKGRIDYQFSGQGQIPDFLYRSGDFACILDAKYVPDYQSVQIEHVRQLSAYARDRLILNKLGDFVERPVPCVIIYPYSNKEETQNPFLNQELNDLLGVDEHQAKTWLQFYTIGVPVPMKMRNS